MTLAQIDLITGAQSVLDRILDRPFTALIELLLIASVIYTTLRFFQGTRGARLVRAVFTILAVSFAIVWLIAEQIQSERIKLLYPYFLLGVFLVSLVAFQTELRRMLLKLGTGGWMRRWVKQGEQVIEPIVSATERLSKNKIGALIAIEQTGEIGAFLESGVRIDSDLTIELLETIFWPGTPLHDLGVIVCHGRLLAAGCQFPLVESGEVDRSLGSRHRAGIGMSQETESVVVIVSEETGTISVAIQGRLRRGLNPDSLRDTLTKELTATPSRKRLQKKKSSASVEADKVSHDGTTQAA